MFERAWMKLVVGLMFAQIALGAIQLAFPGISASIGCFIGFSVGALVFHDLYKNSSLAKV